MKLQVNGGFLMLLTLLFIGLKLSKVIAWSWLWVLSPLWSVFALVFVLWIIIFVAAIIKGL